MLKTLFIALSVTLFAWGQETPVPVLKQSIVITATPIDPAVERRNKEVLEKTLFSRDDQVFHLLDAGINAGQHEGGGKSVEVRRFGFNLDHGGVSGGLKVLIDDVPQNQGTQGHGQGYLGSLKSMTPELVQEVDVHNGPFRAEFGDFSGLGVVHIRMRESMPDKLTLRIQGGSFGAKRGFMAWSPSTSKTDSILAYEGAFSDGPFQKPLGYRRDNVTGNTTWHLDGKQALGFKFNAATNDFNSSGQIPLDEVAAGRLDRFGSIDPGDGGHVRSATLATYYRRNGAKGAVWKADGFVSRSLFDLYSNFTFGLNDPVNGDGIQQHDSRLQQGANFQYTRPHVSRYFQGNLSAGGNFHGNQNTVGLISRVGRNPIQPVTLAHANVTNGAGYVHEVLSFFNGRLQANAGLRYDQFRFQVTDKIDPLLGGSNWSGRAQPKAGLTFTPTKRAPLTLHYNYGRGISSLDARGVVTLPNARHLANTDFQQVGAGIVFSKWSVVTDMFHIDRSNELVYIPDDGSLELAGPTRSYGYEVKTSLAITRHLSFNAGMTKVLNAYYKDTTPREYVDSAPHFTGNAALTLAGWRGWSGSLRMRAINHYRLDPLDDSISASGHTVTDFSLSKPIRKNVEFSLSVDNLTNRDYYETQNYFESRLIGQEPMYRIHATPGYPVNVTVGLTFRFGGK
jgi:outer membrane receptor protein involved in Fe transport